MMLPNFFTAHEKWHEQTSWRVSSAAEIIEKSSWKKYTREETKKFIIGRR